MADSPADDYERELAEFYDAECHDRVGRSIAGMRLDKRSEAFASFLSPTERPLLDIGMGPARETADFVAAGFTTVGFDLSLESCRYAMTGGVTVVNGSVLRLPFRDQTFADVWSMSVLMHLGDDAVVRALHEIARVLAPGGHVALGTWGGDGELTMLENEYGPARPFYHRSDATWQAIVGDAIGPVVDFDTGHYDLGPGTWYQWCVAQLRA